MRKNRTILIAVVAVIGFLTSCQKVIQLDLSTTSPQLVIQGDIYDEPGPYAVKISKTIDFDKPNIYPPVTNATVTITDNTGKVDNLSQAADGTYVTSTLQGVIGRTYTLTVTIDGKTYTAISTMPEAVNIDTIYSKKSFFGNDKVIVLDFVNPPTKENYYQVVHLVNGKQIPGFSVFDNNSNLVEKVSFSFMTTNITPELVAGDMIDVWLERIDKGVFEYFRTANRNGGRSTSPANPVSNISNGALGYFSACSVRKKTFTYK